MCLDNQPKSAVNTISASTSQKIPYLLNIYRKDLSWPSALNDSWIVLVMLFINMYNYASSFYVTECSKTAQITKPLLHFLQLLHNTGTTRVTL